jgi:hypothetical protein
MIGWRVIVPLPVHVVLGSVHISRSRDGAEGRGSVQIDYLHFPVGFIFFQEDDMVGKP